MSIMLRFENINRQRSELENWCANIKNIDSQNKSHYTLRILGNATIHPDFHGQSHPGAGNYHDAPSWFAAGEIRGEIESRRYEILDKAYRAAHKRLDDELLAIESEVADAMAKARAPLAPMAVAP